MGTAPNPTLTNAQQRAIVTGNAIQMMLPIYAGTVNPNTNPVLNVPVRNAGLILGFIVEVTGGVTNGAATVANRTGFGSSNAVQNFTFTDLNGIQRINTSGSHIAYVNSAKQGWGFGGAYAPNLPMAFGNNWAPFAASNTLAADAAGTVTHTYFVPLAYSNDDLRGAIYGNVVNATMNLAITLTTSAQLGVAAGANPLNAIYAGNDNIAWTGNVSVSVQQVILDQLPTMNGAPVLPMQDLNTIYDLKSTAIPGLSVGQDLPIPYANFRSFLSTTVYFDNGGTFNSGSDVNYWALRAASATELWRISPNLAALQARQIFMADPPPGVYYFDHRKRPIDTITFGNMELILNPSVVNAGARAIVNFEAFTQTAQLGAASSING